VTAQLQSNEGRHRLIGRSLTVLGLVALAFLCLFPLYRMVIGSLQSTTDVTSGSIVPAVPANTKGYSELLDRIPIWRNLLNSLIVTTLGTALFLFVSVTAGYAFAKHRFPGGAVIFGLFLATLAIPGSAVIVPLFLEMRDLGWLDSYQALILPLGANAFGIFWLRQYIATGVPDELLDAARMDGAGELRIVMRVVVPVCRPAIAALGALWFMLAWNDFLWPLVATSTPHRYTIPVAIASLYGIAADTSNFVVVLAGSVIATLPLIILFLFVQKHVVGGVSGRIRA
jgi:ABC-type glycerol-3-phosphate transport system permease component